jgi:hypothetical protein
MHDASPNNVGTYRRCVFQRFESIFVMLVVVSMVSVLLPTLISSSGRTTQHLGMGQMGHTSRNQSNRREVIDG